MPLGDGKAAQARALWRSVGPAGGARRCVPINHFPLLLLGYGDFWDLADAVAHAVSSQPEVVMVFAPQFLLGELIHTVRSCV